MCAGRLSDRAAARWTWRSCAVSLLVLLFVSGTDYSSTGPALLVLAVKPYGYVFSSIYVTVKYVRHLQIL